MKHWLISTHPVSHALYTQIQTNKNHFQQLAYSDLRTRSDAVWQVGRSVLEGGGVRRVWRSVAECGEFGQCGGVWWSVAVCGGVWRNVAE